MPLETRHPRTIIGLMSGTSGDGVDAAAVGFGAGRTELIGFESLQYSREFRHILFAIRANQQVDLGELAGFTRELTLLHAEVSKQLMAKVGKVDLISAHGQTLFHAPPLTMQVLDPSLLAQETGVDVASDFRRSDCAAGGQGAPLVPLADHVLFSHPTENRVLLNLGGIANLTFLRAGGGLDEVVAFDTGPANCVLDHLWRGHGLPSHDVGGAVACTGKANQSIARDAALRADGLWERLWPKSTDTPAMIRAFAQAGGESLALPDALATACAMSAILVARGIGQLVERLDAAGIDRLIASGGGVHNAALVKAIELHTRLRIETTDRYGVPLQAKEAIAFAILGQRLLNRESGNIPRVTGARCGVILGSITHSG